MSKLEINIGIFGCVSVGKGTFLNAIMGQKYSDTEIKKTTTIPQAYIESYDSIPDANDIRMKNRSANENGLKLINNNQFNINDCQIITHQIDRMYDLLDPLIIDPNIKINIYDLPGLNDASSKQVYFEWVRQNIRLFDIIIFMTDIVTGLETSDQIDVLKLLLESMTKTSARMICLMNKCDGLYFSNEANDLVFNDSEIENFYLESNNNLERIAKSYGFMNGDNRVTAFIPFSAENCFIYRTLLKKSLIELDEIYIQKVCRIEGAHINWIQMPTFEKEAFVKYFNKDLDQKCHAMIKNSGYMSIKAVIQNTINENKLEFFLSHLENDSAALLQPTITNITTYINSIHLYRNKLQKIQILRNSKIKISYQSLWTNVKTTISRYVAEITNSNTKITLFRNFIGFREFDQMHSTMQIHCLNIASLIESLKDIPEYPEDFMEEMQKQTIRKLMSIYEQLNLVEWCEQTHISPNNLCSYLRVMQIYAPREFDSYAIKFLENCCNLTCKNLLLREKELCDLLHYIIHNLEYYMLNYSTILRLASILLINKITLCADRPPEKYFDYLVKIKKQMQKIIAEYPSNYSSFIDIIYEVIDKRIMILLSTNGVTNFYKPDIDLAKVFLILNKAFESIDDSELCLEKEILNMFSSKKLID